MKEYYNLSKIKVLMVNQQKYLSHLNYNFSNHYGMNPINKGTWNTTMGSTIRRWERIRTAPLPQPKQKKEIFFFYSKSESSTSSSSKM